MENQIECMVCGTKNDSFTCSVCGFMSSASYGVMDAEDLAEEAKYADKHDDVFVATDTTVDEWFNFWIENISTSNNETY